MTFSRAWGILTRSDHYFRLTGVISQRMRLMLSQTRLSQGTSDFQKISRRICLLVIHSLDGTYRIESNALSIGLIRTQVEKIGTMQRVLREYPITA